VSFQRVLDDGPQWYYISTVLEWWPGWCCFEVTRQLNATDINNLLAQVKNGANP
jgi:hypothetical protein